jgi:hypothetical protein
MQRTTGRITDDSIYLTTPVTTLLVLNPLRSKISRDEASLPWIERTRMKGMPSNVAS